MIMDLTKGTVVHMLTECCKDNRLSCNNLQPSQVSPGVWRFKAVEMNDNCSKHGHCRQMTYYARLVDDRMVLC